MPSIPKAKPVEDEVAKATRYRELANEILAREEAIVSTFPPCTPRAPRRRARTVRT